MEVGPPPRPLYLRPSDARPARSPGPRRAASRSRWPTACTRESLPCCMRNVSPKAGTRPRSQASWPCPAPARFLPTPGSREPAGFMLVRQAADEGEILTIGTRPAASPAGHRHDPPRPRQRTAARRRRAPALHRGGGVEFRRPRVLCAIGLRGSRVSRPAYYAMAGGARGDAIVMSRVSAVMMACGVARRDRRFYTSSRMNDIERACIEKHMRMTGQRRTIARVIAEAADHPDVEELHRRAIARRSPHLARHRLSHGAAPEGERHTGTACLRRSRAV